MYDLDLWSRIWYNKSRSLHTLYAKHSVGEVWAGLGQVERCLVQMKNFTHRSALVLSFDRALITCTGINNISLKFHFSVELTHFIPGKNIKMGYVWNKTIMPASWYTTFLSPCSLSYCFEVCIKEIFVTISSDMVRFNQIKYEKKIFFHYSYKKWDYITFKCITVTHFLEFWLIICHRIKILMWPNNEN